MARGRRPRPPGNLPTRNRAEAFPLDLVVVSRYAEVVDMAEMSEQSMVAEVEQRLTIKYPYVPPDRITRVVQTAHSRFDQSSIRDFIPLLVERRAKAELAQSDQAALASPSPAPGAITA